MAENVFETISRRYYELTAAEKKAADYVLANREQCQTLSIAELAESCGVAEATVSRFCRSLGYSGFHIFKMAIAGAAASLQEEGGMLSGPVLPEDSMEEMCQKLYSADQNAMHETLELIEEAKIKKAADMLEEAGRVVCMGQGGSMVMAEEASHLFSMVSGKFSAVPDSHSQIVTAVNMSPGDLILFFSYSGATKDMMDTMQAAALSGVKILLVTRFPNSPGAALADLVLPCGSNENPLQVGSVPARIAQLFLLDVLFSEYCRRDLKSGRMSRERIAAAMEGKHL